jgi:PAS domain S-box-containing protein
VSEPQAQNKSRWFALDRLLVRGEALIAIVGIALAGVITAGIGAAGWWSLRSQRESLDLARREQVRSVSGILAQSAESMLANGELSSLRREIIDSKLQYSLVQCRIVLPNNTVIADADPTKITAVTMPKPWPSGPVDTDQSVDRADEITITRPLVIQGRGGATLQIVAPATTALASDRDIESGLAAIGAISLAVLLVIYRKLRARIIPLSMIREGLIAIKNGESSKDVLAMRGDMGPEADAWNDLLNEAAKMRSAAIAERARGALDQRRGAPGELEHACDALAVGLVVVDDTGIVKHVNGAAAAMLQAKRDQVLGAKIGDYVHEEQLKQSIAAIASGTRAERKTIELERPETAGGGVIRVHVRPLRRENEHGALITVEDITQQRVAEKARNSFVAQATHELRTPLTNMRLYLEEALDDVEKDPVALAKSLNVINIETRRLERMVGEMLSVAEIEAGSLKIKTDDVRLDAVFHELEADYKPQAAEKKITLKFDLPPKFPVITGDRDRLMLALHNLIANALKYTPSGGNVIVTVKSEATKLTVTVVDSGIGIEEKEHALIFEKFYRAKDPRVTKITGTGLGLALAREVARLHGGDIIVQSVIDRGSTFTLTVPLTAQAA